MTEKEAYAIGYYFGRCIGNDEEMAIEMYDRVGNHGIYNDNLFAAAKEGYERGVSDYCDFDLLSEVAAKINHTAV